MAESLDTWFPRQIQDIIEQFLEAGIILHTTTGEKVFFNETKLIRNYGFFRYYDFSALHDTNYVFRVNNNELYFGNASEENMFKLVGTKWEPYEHPKDDIHAKLRCFGVACVFEDKLFSYNCSRMLWEGLQEGLLGQFPIQNPTINFTIMCGFEGKLFLYSAYAFAYFDLTRNTFHKCACPPIKILKSYNKQNTVIFNRGFYVFGQHDVQVYKFDESKWTHFRMKKFPQNIIGCLVCD